MVFRDECRMIFVQSGVIGLVIDVAAALRGGWMMTMCSGSVLRLYHRTSLQD
ncbi:hypothetical protein [Acetobacter oeni]|uniref:hypothetical protein n=1 Tax=Acetobacter oeni TaxID=304077 RepID=UPI001568B51C|nr:hypothetical protein [Acetobacter oeni]MBB3882306.1 hypothetical protein [Acetobacter oeni]NHO18588.1 hypothetical protein [Acetobacter oeni]